jgi:hypothetical protein
VIVFFSPDWRSRGKKFDETEEWSWLAKKRRTGVLILTVLCLRLIQSLALSSINIPGPLQ